MHNAWNAFDIQKQHQNWHSNFQTEFRKTVDWLKILPFKGRLWKSRAICIRVSIVFFCFHYTKQSNKCSSQFVSIPFLCGIMPTLQRPKQNLDVNNIISKCRSIYFYHTILTYHLMAPFCAPCYFSVCPETPLSHGKIHPPDQAQLYPSIVACPLKYDIFWLTQGSLKLIEILMVFRDHSTPWRNLLEK